MLNNYFLEYNIYLQRINQCFRISFISEYSDKKGKSEDIQDPMGAPLEIYRDTRDQIKGYVAQIASKM